MQNKRSKALVIALIIGLIAILSVGTLAWFTDSDEVENTLKFTDSFSIDVYETDETGAAIVDGNKETTGTTYTDLMPGQKIHKDPTIKNDGTHPEWVRVSITFNNLTVLAPLFPNGASDIVEYMDGFDPTLWVVSTTEDYVKVEGDTVTFTGFLKDKLAAGATATVFTDITIPGALDNDDAAALAENPLKITVKAEAIQSEFLPTTITTAEAAFAYVEGN